MRRGVHAVRTGLLLAAATGVVACSSSGSPSGAAGSTGPAGSSSGSAITTEVEQWTDLTVEVDGSPVLVRCKGVARGTPPVVFVSGLAEDGRVGWLDSGVPDAVAATTKACVYDRPGLGGSAPSPSDRGMPRHAEELASVIDKAGIGVPVVLVADGYGTFIARQFATPSGRRADTAGMVLIDPPLWPLDETVPDGLSDGARAEHESVSVLNEELALYGAGNMPPPPVPVVVLGVDPSLSARPVAGATPDGSAPEGTAPDGTAPDGTAPDGTAPEGTAPAGTTPGSTPGPPTEVRHDSQRQLAQKSPFGRFEVVAGAGTKVQFWKPEVVTAAILGLKAS